MILPAIAMLMMFVGMMSILVVLVRLRDHRTDLKPHESFGQGQSPFWQMNVANPANYTPEGRRLLRWLWATQGLWMGGCLLAIYCLMTS